MHPEAPIKKYGFFVNPFPHAPRGSHKKVRVSISFFTFFSFQSQFIPATSNPDKVVAAECSLTQTDVHMSFMALTLKLYALASAGENVPPTGKHEKEGGGGERREGTEN